MSNFKLTLEYDGTAFSGWQFQSNGRSVQEAVESALAEIVREPVRIAGAGRTDAGVHARGQVASFRLDGQADVGLLRKGLNAVLPEDVVVLNAEAVDDGFHARFSAKRRRYAYYVSTRPTAIWRKYAWWLTYDLDLDVMNRCASQVKGSHFLESFCKSDSGVENTQCHVDSAAWLRNGSYVEFHITADRYLRGMVRALVGTMVEIGRGFRPFKEFESILAARDRRSAGASAPPHGLFLEEVIY